jgi:hypothetical protein
MNEYDTYKIKGTWNQHFKVLITTSTINDIWFFWHILIYVFKSNQPRKIQKWKEKKKKWTFNDTKYKEQEEEWEERNKAP